ncbi:hypothetical protein ACFYW8_22415 [Streptomyces sp. NPDC002742]|uniref:hypothetical protein n=1 Tax=Streptomyces sp. NPDC002742 TaxID=3364663 RepID=UPI0036A6C00F
MTWKPAGAEIAESFGLWGAMLFVLLITGQYFGVTLTESTAIVHSLRRRTIQSTPSAGGGWTTAARIGRLSCFRGRG